MRTMTFFQNVFSNEIGVRLVDTAIAAFVSFLIYILISSFMKKRCVGARAQQKVKHRTAYLSIVFFLLMMIHVWVEGFAHVFTMLSLIAAGIVVTNKENIMNLAGWLIINWRGVFSEGDYIQIQSMVGYVEAVKLFTFKLIETRELGDARATGRTIKVPNGLIITNPVYIFPSEKTLMLQHIDYTVSLDEVGLSIAEQLRSLVVTMIQSQYASDPNYSTASIRRYNRPLSKLMHLEPQVTLKLIADKPEKLLLSVLFYSYPRDRSLIEKEIARSFVQLNRSAVDTAQTELTETATH